MEPSRRKRRELAEPSARLIVACNVACDMKTPLRNGWRPGGDAQGKQSTAPGRTPSSSSRIATGASERLRTSNPPDAEDGENRGQHDVRRQFEPLNAPVVRDRLIRDDLVQVKRV